MSFAEDQEEARRTSFWKSVTVISEQPYRVLLEAPDPEPEPEPPPERVGYGHPPKEHRFKPGQSGNPGGRPRGSKNKCKEIERLGPRLKALIRAEADRTITLRENGGPVTMTMLEAVLRRVGYDAGRGQARAQKLFLELVAKMEADDERLRQEHFEGALNWKLDAEAEIARRKARGVSDTSDIVPHPDDIIIYHRAGIAELVGPFSAEEKAAWKQKLGLRRTLHTYIADETAKLMRQRSPKRRAETTTSIEMLGEMLAKLEATLPDWVERD